VDANTPAGKMAFTVLGAVTELERSLICERVRAGIRNAKAKGRRLGRPRVAVDAARIAPRGTRGLRFAARQATGKDGDEGWEVLADRMTGRLMLSFGFEVVLV